MNPKLLKVTFKGKKNSVYSGFEGIYFQSSKSVNHRPNWIQRNKKNAIWYDDWNWRWGIGPKDGLGTEEKVLFYSTDDVIGPQHATEWGYDKHKIFTSDDNIIVEAGN